MCGHILVFSFTSASLIVVYLISGVRVVLLQEKAVFTVRSFVNGLMAAPAVDMVYMARFPDHVYHFILLTFK